jgi:hypothetical protein
MSLFSFFMRFKSFQKLISDVELKAQFDFAEQLKIHSHEMDLNQLELERNFKWSNHPRIIVNIWDDDEPTDHGLNTFAYIESENLPNLVCYEVLEKLQNYLRAEQIQCRMTIRDELILYPHLVLDRNNPKKLHKRWVLVIEGIKTYDSFFSFTSKLQRIHLEHKGSVLKFFSENQGDDHSCR